MAGIGNINDIWNLFGIGDTRNNKPAPKVNKPSTTASKAPSRGSSAIPGLAPNDPRRQFYDPTFWTQPESRPGYKAPPSFGEQWTGFWGKQDNTPVSQVAAPPVKSTKGIWDYKYTAPYENVAYAGQDAGNQIPGIGQMSYADALTQAQQYLQGLGIGQYVSYDPYRQAERSQYTMADAKTKAMYDQLQKSIAGEAKPLGAAYDTSLGETKQASQDAINQLTQAAQAGADIKTQQAKALGIEEAVANSLQRGSDPSRDITRANADTAARGQITSNLLTSNRATALDRNSDLVGAAGVAGQQQRDQRANELAKILAQLDVSESQANQNIQRDYVSQSTSLANQLLSGNRNDIQQADLNAYRAQMLANQQANRSTGSSGSTRPAPMSRDQAVQTALDDYGYATLSDVPPNVIQNVIAQASKYQGY